MQMARRTYSYMQAVFLLLLLCACSVHASVMPLTGEDAFRFSLDRSNPQQIYANWQIAPGYFLYRDKLKITVTPENKVEKIVYPQGEYKFDPIRGRIEVFASSLSIPIILNSEIKSGQILVEYQGCSSGGFCYPPMRDVVNIGAGDTSASALLTDQNKVEGLLAQQNFAATLSIFLLLGLLLAFTPCVLPMIPILTGIIVGQKGGVTTKRAFLLSITYVLGSSITYAAAGLAAASMGSSLQAYLQKPLIIVAASSIFIFLAFSLFGAYHLRLPSWLQQHVNRVTHKTEGGNYLGVFAMGSISTLIVSPCVTAPLIGVLIYIGQTGDKVLGAAALFSMGIGMGIPLLLIGMSAGKLLPKTGPWMVAIKEMFGILLLGMAIWMLARILPIAVTKLLWIALTAGALSYISINLARAKRLHRKWAYTLGVFAGLASLVLIAGNMKDLMNSPIMANNFIVVRSVEDLQKQLSLAQEQHKSVLVDFYADWCESCVAMEKVVFNEPKVQRALENYTLIRADLTANDNNDEQLMQEYAIFAPPTVLLFNKLGKENDAQRIVGEVDVKEFLLKLNHFESASCTNNKINC